METGLTKRAALTQVQVRSREVLHDPLAAILAGQLWEHTRRAYRHDVGHLLVFLRDGAPTTWGEITREAKHAMLEGASVDPTALRSSPPSTVPT
jgi:hypothetical protein